MRYTILVFAITLAVGTTQARAEFVSYNFTGTIKTADSYSSGNPLPFSPGDHLTWTLLYDRSTPLVNSDKYYSGYQSYYVTKYPVLINLVDQTNGYHFPWTAGGGGILLFGDSTKDPSSLVASAGNANLFLVYKESFPTSNLSDWQLNSIPLNLPHSDFNYYVQYADSQPEMSFDASVNSMSGPIAGIPSAPEPGSFTLFLLGAAGLVARGMRRRLRAACLRRPLLTH